MTPLLALLYYMPNINNYSAWTKKIESCPFQYEGIEPEFGQPFHLKPKSV